MLRRLCEHKGALAATANALLLGKCLRQRLWDSSGLEVRQLPGIGKLLGERLAAAGLGKLRALAAAEPRRIEAVTQRHFPFGARWQPPAAGLRLFTPCSCACL
jgi:ATP-dependent DNA helicase HFM1/MER3